MPTALMLLPLVFAGETIRALALYGALISVSAATLHLRASLRHLRQLRRNLREAEVYDGDYVLLLRSFGQTSGYQTDAHATGTDGITIVSEASIIGNLDAIVQASGLRLVTVGGDLVLPPTSGVFWLQCQDGDAWMETVAHLARGAKSILLLPETTGGVVEEVRFLHREDLLGRTIAVMAPLPRPSFVADYPKADDRAAAWGHAAETLAAEGLHLPHYDPLGAIFRFNPKGGAEGYRALTGEHGVVKSFDAIPIKGEVKRKLSRIFSDMMADCDPGGRPFSDVFPNLKIRPAIEEPVNLLCPPGMSLTPATLWLMMVFGGVFFTIVAIVLTLLGV